MKILLKILHQSAFGLLLLLLNQFLTSCTPALSPALPPENYKGPVAEQPVLQQGDYWVYETGNATRAKSTRLYSNLNFPLWVGKTWSYETEVRTLIFPNQFGEGSYIQEASFLRDAKLLGYQHKRRKLCAIPSIT